MQRPVVEWEPSEEGDSVTTGRAWIPAAAVVPDPPPVPTPSDADPAALVIPRAFSKLIAGHIAGDFPPAALASAVEWGHARLQSRYPREFTQFQIPPHTLMVDKAVRVQFSDLVAARILQTLLLAGGSAVSVRDNTNTTVIVRPSYQNQFRDLSVVHRIADVERWFSRARWDPHREQFVVSKGARCG